MMRTLVPLTLLLSAAARLAQAAPASIEQRMNELAKYGHGEFTVSFTAEAKDADTLKPCFTLMQRAGYTTVIRLTEGHARLEAEQRYNAPATAPDSIAATCTRTKTIGSFTYAVSLKVIQPQAKARAN